MRTERFSGNAQADSISRAIMRYIWVSSSEDLAYLDDELSRANEAALCALGKNNMSHMLQAFYFTTDIHKKDPRESSEEYFRKISHIIENLFSVLMRHSERFPKAKELLLTTPNNAGFTPLHQLLVSGTAHNVYQYLKEVFEFGARHQGPTNSIYTNLLTSRTRDGSTTLLIALRSKDQTKIRHFLETLDSASVNGFLNNRQSNELLIKRNQTGFSSLHYAFMSGVGYLLLDRAHKARTKDLSDTDFKNFLLLPNTSFFTPLLQCLISADWRTLGEYLQIVQDLWSRGKITHSEHGALLLRRNADNYSPLQAVMKSHDFEKMRLYCEAVWEAVTKGSITPEEFKELLIRSNTPTYTLIADVLNSGSVEILNLYLNLWNKAQDSFPSVFTAEDFGNLFINFDEAKYSPIARALKSAKPELAVAFMTWLRDAKNRMAKEKYRDFFLLPNQEEYTSLDEILRSGKKSILLCYFDLLWDAQKSGVINATDYKNLLHHFNSRGIAPFYYAINTANYDFFRQFVMIFEETLGLEFLTQTISVLSSPGRRKIHCFDTTEDARNINSLIDLLMQGRSLLDESRSTDNLLKRARLDGQPDITSAAKPHDEPPESAAPRVVPGANLTGLLRATFPPKPVFTAQTASSGSITPTPSPMMLAEIMKLTQPLSMPKATETSPQEATPPAPPRDFIAETKQKMIAISEMLVGDCGLAPEQIYFYGSTAQLLAGHPRISQLIVSLRDVSGAPNDLDLKLFIIESSLNDFLQKLSLKQQAVRIQDCGPHLLIKGFSLDTSRLTDGIDIQVIKMKVSDSLSEAVDRSRWASHLNVCTDYCTYDPRSTVKIIPHPGRAHANTVHFLDSKGEPRRINHLFDLYADPRDMKPKDLFFFLKKWHYFVSAKYNVRDLEIAIIKTLAYRQGFELARHVFIQRDNSGNRIGAEILCALINRKFSYESDEAYELYHPHILRKIYPRVNAVFYTLETVVAVVAPSASVAAPLVSQSIFRQEAAASTVNEKATTGAHDEAGTKRKRLG